MNPAKYAEIEWLDDTKTFGVLRVWSPDEVPGKANRRPYYWCCTVRDEKQGTLELMGVCKNIDRHGWKAIQAMCCDEGYKFAQYERATKKGFRTVRFKGKRL